MAITISGDSPNLTSPNITGAVVSSMASSVITSGTSVASTSGTSIDFTGIPSWVKRITIMFYGVSTSGTSIVQVQLGTGSTPTYTTSGYGGSVSFNSASTVTSTGVTTGLGVSGNFAAADARNGIMTITNVTGNTWVSSSVVGLSTAANVGFGAGSIALGAALTAIRITTVNGTDTFDAGSINILYE